MGSKNKPRPPDRQLWLVPQEGQPRHELVADVAVNVPTTGLLTYSVPAELADAVSPGSKVRVPYGRGGREVDGLCLGVSEQPWDQTRKPILGAVPAQPWVSATLVELGLWAADYYACSLWKTFVAILPKSLRTPRTTKIRYARACEAGLHEKVTPKQAAVIAELRAGERRRDELLASAGVGAGVLDTLRRRGLVEIVVREEPARRPVSAGVQANEPVRTAEDEFDLTAGQQVALSRIGEALDREGESRVALLFGVPGSGKTEVYVRAARQVIESGRQVILLIPEIALTTQLIDRLRRRFARVAVLHSQLTPRTRLDTLAAVGAGEVDIVIGTRSAVFAPCPRLGLIIVDEEQEGSFKNLAAPYYHARDVAIKRGQLGKVPVVLGSATPSLESWHNVQTRSHYELLRLPERVPGARLPAVRLIHNPRRDGPVLSPELCAALRAALDAGQQAILLHNRRGYAVFLRCGRCGLMISCERCGSHMVYHRAENRLKCHRCARQSGVPQVCPDETCRGRLERSGSAIQRVEAELSQLLPAARLLRLDRDTMRRRESYEAALRRFEAREADVLLGTQMVAKGLDFPGVRLVGVVEADAALSLPDFRAGERVFQLVVQVVGRAGRREGSSLALVQSQHRSRILDDALRQDYESFAARELEVRKTLLQPPWARLVRFVCSDRRPRRAREAAEGLAAELGALAGRVHASIRVERAEPCVIPRLREMLRWQVLLRGPQGTSVQRMLRVAASEKLLGPRVERFTIDVDPVDLF